MVLPRWTRGTTMGGADVENYIRPYYHTEAALGQGATVLRLQRSGTTVGSSGTTAGAYGTIAPESSTTASSAVAARISTKRITEGSSKVQGKGGGKEGNVYVMIPPEPFRHGPPLNSTALL